MKACVCNVLQALYPEACSKCKAAQVPAADLALSWISSLFGKIKPTNKTLISTTRLAAWDVCILLGKLGVVSVAVSLFGCVAKAIESFEESSELRNRIAETTLRKVIPLPDFTLYNECASLLSKKTLHPILTDLLQANNRKLEHQGLYSCGGFEFCETLMQDYFKTV